MHRNVTAIYRTYQVADLVRQRLTDLGVSHRHIRVIPDRDEAVGTEGYRDDGRHIDALHDLHLPDNDLRTYQQSVRNGDYVVSAEVDENTDIAPIQEAMRRPETETYDYDTRAAQFRDEALIARSQPGADPDPNRRGEPDPDHADPYTRSYRRGGPLGTYE